MSLTEPFMLTAPGIFGLFVVLHTEHPDTCLSGTVGADLFGQFFLDWKEIRLVKDR